MTCMLGMSQRNGTHINSVSCMLCVNQGNGTHLNSVSCMLCVSQGNGTGLKYCKCLPFKVPNSQCGPWKLHYYLVICFSPHLTIHSMSPLSEAVSF